MNTTHALVKRYKTQLDASYFIQQGHWYFATNFSHLNFYVALRAFDLIVRALQQTRTALKILIARPTVKSSKRRANEECSIITMPARPFVKISITFKLLRIFK